MRGLKVNLSSLRCAYTPGFLGCSKANESNYIYSNEECLWDAAQNNQSALLSEGPSVQEVQSKPNRMDELKAIEERKRNNPCLQPQSDKPQPQHDNPLTIQGIFGNKRRDSIAKSASKTPPMPSTVASANDRKNTTRSSRKNDSHTPEAPPAVRRSTRNKERESEERAPDADEV